MNFYSKKFHGIKQVNAYCLTMKDAKNTSAQVISLSGAPYFAICISFPSC